MRITSICLIIGMITSATFPIAAQGIFGQEGNTGLQFSGSFLTDVRTELNQPFTFQWQEYRLRLNAEARFGRKGHLFTETWIRSLGFATPENIDELMDIGEVLPMQLLLREAYLDVYGLLLPNLDLRIGRQLISWGSAYQINPTDNLNANDLEDIFDFGRQLAADAAKINVYWGNYSVEGVFTPFFRPAVLPQKQIWEQLSAREISLPQQFSSLIEIQNITDTLELPDKTPGDGAQGGIRLGGRVAGFDVALSYVYGRDDFPALSQLELVFPDTVTASTIQQALIRATPIAGQAKTTLIFPRRHVAGFDISGALGDIGVWAEGAIFFPEKVDTRARLSSQIEGFTPGIAALLPENAQAFLSGENVVEIFECTECRFCRSLDYSCSQ
jgi:hypothetical protein